jgi:hypothetical protein
MTLALTQPVTLTLVTGSPTHPTTMTPVMGSPTPTKA